MKVFGRVSIFLIHNLCILGFRDVFDLFLGLVLAFGFWFGDSVLVFGVILRYVVQRNFVVLVGLRGMS